MMQTVVVGKVSQNAHLRMGRPARISVIYRLTGRLELTKHELFAL